MSAARAALIGAAETSRGPHCRTSTQIFEMAFRAAYRRVIARDFPDTSRALNARKPCFGTSLSQRSSPSASLTTRIAI